ncbi:MAG TPA: hypothetical protein VF613_08045 [Longimicrobium sp.]|jgi:hypothetical protein
MGQTTSIAHKFGVSVALRSEVEPATAQRMQRLLKDQLEASGTSVPSNAQIYVKQLRIAAKRRHFGVSDVPDRVESVRVSASLPKDATKAGKIVIHDLGLQTDPSISVTRSAARLSYSLPGAYIASHDEYTDYIAVIVKPGCPQKMKKLEVQISAQATAEFARHLRNVPDGRVLSKLTFWLAPNIQLTLAV